MIFEDAFSSRLALRATGRLAALNRADVLEAADVHVATRLAALAGGAMDEDVLLAVALAVRSVRLGAVCVDLAEPPELSQELLDRSVDVDVDVDEVWPDTAAWVTAVAADELATRGVLRLEGTRLYLDRHWREERAVCDDVVERLRATPPEVDEPLLVRSLARLFPDGWEEQREAAEVAARQHTMILTGGPGTGKTASVARLLVALAEQHVAATGRAPRVALAAPTGKASTRLMESVTRERAKLGPEDAARLEGITSSTLHRLLGWRPDSSTRFRHHRTNPLPYDVVVVDEVSMVSLSQMARLLEAVPRETRLVLVGDAAQLSSVEAGAVLADLVEGLGEHPSSPVRRLRTTHRTADDDAGRTLDALAEAVRQDDADLAVQLLDSGVPGVRRVDPGDAPALAGVRAEVVEHADQIALAAADGDAERALALVESHRLLCAHREGPAGVSGWNRQVLHALTENAALGHLDEWYSGRPVLVTANDRGLRLSNGDLGVTVLTAEKKLRVMIRVEGELVPFAPTRLSGVDTVYAMTVHKSQGSEARSVTVVLPPDDSPLLTRELFYTALTRARERLTVVGSADAVRAAIGRRVQRASGLGERLRTALGGSAPAG